MKIIEFTELKLIQLKILNEIDLFCRSNNIKYSLAYGTLIGAVRHKGYIPWDDDIDIMMPRDDYMYFINSFHHKYLKVFSPDICSNYYAPYANIIDSRTILIENSNNIKGLGVKIDVFPIDSVPDNKFCRKILFGCVYFLKIIIKCNNGEFLSKHKFFSKSINFIFKYFLFWVSVPYILNKLAIQQNRINYKSKLVNNIVWCACNERGCFNKDSMIKYMDIVFEGCKFKSIESYDNFLKSNYGDYMKLPPEDKRIRSHGFVAYWK